MGEALIKGILTAGLFKSHQITVTDISSPRRRFLKKKYRIRVLTNNREAVRGAEVIVLAVKPSVMAAVAEELSGTVKPAQLVISIAAGIRLKKIEEKLKGIPVIRAMPNNPALTGKGITALSPGSSVRGKALGVAGKIFQAVGEAVTVPERLMDAVTGLSGSGPAFVYLLLEGMIAAGEKVGLTRELASRLAVGTVLGAAQTVKVSGEPPEKLKEMVISPRGTTLAGLKVLEKYRFKTAIAEAIIAAAARAKELSSGG